MLRITRHNVLLIVVLWGSALMGATAVSHAQISPYPVVVTMTGPATAVSGEELTYSVRYRLTEPETLAKTSIVIEIPRNTAYVSTEVVSGPSGVFVGETDSLVRWGDVGSAEETDGELALTVRISDTFVGLIHGGCFIPGTETSNPESQCSLETQVFAPGTQPEAGSGAAADGSGFPIVPALLALSGAALAGIVLVAAGTTIRGRAT